MLIMAVVSPDTGPVTLRRFRVLQLCLSLNSLSATSPVTGCKCRAQRVPLRSGGILYAVRWLPGAAHGAIHGGGMVRAEGTDFKSESSCSR